MKTNKKEKLILRPSAASIWTVCPGYLHFQSSKDILEQNAPASLGSAVHDIADVLITCVENWDKPFPLDWVKKYISVLPETQKNLIQNEMATAMRYLVMIYNKVARDMRFFLTQYSRKDISILSETHRKYEGKNYILQGTADLTIITPDGLYVDDYKTGMIEVDVISNSQLTAYAHLLYEELRKIRLIEEVHVSIIQPSVNAIATETVTIDPQYFRKLEDHVKRTDCVTGIHCKYCPYGDTCNALRTSIDEFLTVVLPNGVHTTRELSWLQWLELAPVLEKQIERVKELSKKYIEMGVEVPGWEIYQRNTQRRWIAELSPDELAKGLKLKRKDIIEEKLKTPKAVEELIKTDKLDLFNSYVVQGQSVSLRKIKI